MKKKSYLVVCGISLIVLFLACQAMTAEVWSKNESVIVQVEEDSVNFWIDKMEQPDAVIMNLDAIEKYNRRLKTQKRDDWPAGCHEVKDFSEEIDAKWLRDRMDYFGFRNMQYYLNGVAVTEKQWDVYYDAMNREKLQEKVSPKYGLIVHNTPMLDLPTEDILTDSGMNEAENRLQQTTLKINEPVVVLWESEDKAWYYAVSNEYIGWIKNKDCALMKSREEWLVFQERENFLMVYDDGIMEIAEPVLMGTKLYLAEKEVDKAQGAYMVSMPQRDEEGYAVYIDMEISKENKVCEGYLLYTGRNVLELAFSRLGDPYGWGGIDGKRDCSSYIKDIYRCFGFELPRNSRAQMTLPGMVRNTERMPETWKERILNKTTPGAILGINGHVMIYIGDANQQYYVISMLGSYIPETVTEDFGNHVVNANKVMVNTLDVKRKNGNTWLQELLDIVSLKP